MNIPPTTWAERVIVLLADRYEARLIEEQIPFVSGQSFTPEEAAARICIRLGIETAEEVRQRFGGHVLR